MGFERFVAWRFMLRGTERGRFSPMTLLAWVAIAIGVFAMSSILSIMYGFETSLKSRFLRAYPHVMVKRRTGSAPLADYQPWTDKLKGVSGVQRVMPYLEAEMIVQATRRTLGAVAWGIPGKDMESLSRDISSGNLPDPDAQTPEILMGKELAQSLDIFLGQEVRLVSPVRRTGTMGLVPKSQVFRVSGYYASGHYEFDQQYIFLLEEDARDLLGWKDSISGWHVWAGSLEGADGIQKNIAAIIPGDWEAQSWTEFNSALFESLNLEQFSMFIILSLAILIAVMNVAITLIMHVTQKRKNIGILCALGASRKQVRKVFLWQGALLGAVGLVAGGLSTVVFLIYISYFSGYLLPDIYYDRTIPVEIRPLSFILIYLVAIVMIFIATLYPAIKAARTNPIEAIRE